MKGNYSLVSMVLCSFLFCIMIIGNVLADENINDKLIFIGKIEAVSTLTDKPRFNPWHIEVAVTTIVNSGEVDLKNGDKVNLYLHGIVRIFGGLEKDIIGKTFKFIMLDKFSENYSGKIIVEPIFNVEEKR